MAVSAKYTNEWRAFAQHLVQNELALRGMTMKQLSELLATHGMSIAPKVLSRKISRGTFSAGFFFGVLNALGARSIDLKTGEVTGASKPKPKKSVAGPKPRTWMLNL